MSQFSAYTRLQFGSEAVGSTGVCFSCLASAHKWKTQVTFQASRTVMSSPLLSSATFAFFAGQSCVRFTLRRDAKTMGLSGDCWRIGYEFVGMHVDRQRQLCRHAG